MMNQTIKFTKLVLFIFCLLLGQNLSAKTTSHDYPPKPDYANNNCWGANLNYLPKPIIGIQGPTGSAFWDMHNQQFLPQESIYTTVKNTKARMVRVEFKPCSAGIANYDCHESSINSFVCNQVQIYGLIHTYDYIGNISSNWNESENQLNQYAEYFYGIVNKYKDQVKVYESINEPNITGVSPQTYARLLIKVWNKVRSNPALNNIKIITGPVIVDNKGIPTWQVIQYLQQTIYNIPQSQALPFDGIGLHVYPLKCGNDGNANNLVSEIRDNIINSVWNGLSKASARWALGGNRKIWVSEFGFNNNFLSLSGHKDNPPQGVDPNNLDDMQAWYLAKGLETFKSQLQHKVDAVIVFNIASFCRYEDGCKPGVDLREQDWGLVMPVKVQRNACPGYNCGNCFDDNSIKTKVRKKKAYCVFQKCASSWTCGQAAYNSCANQNTYNRLSEAPTEILKEKLTLFPNPVNQELNILLKEMDELADEELGISIINLTGTVLHQEKFSTQNTSFKINTANYPAGIYFVQLWNDKGRNFGSYKFMKIEE